MEYLNNEKVKDALERAKTLKADESFLVSDIIDAEGHQYVDLVQEGGGVLGIALVGYVTILEAAGIRFYSLAGTSAGAINTMGMAAVGKMEEEKAPKLLKLLDEQDLFEFVDGSNAVKRFIKAYIENPSFQLVRMILNSFSVYRALKKNLGLNPGDAFEKWVADEVFGKNGIHTTSDLLQHRAQLPDGLKHRNGTPYENPSKLLVITSDVTTKTKVKFPEMRSLYWSSPDETPPSKYVRASMSIPGFFYPFKVDHIPNDGAAKARWENDVRYYGPIPKSVRFVDGGMLSNFPINAFHVTIGLPTRPTFGARLSAYRKEESDTSAIGPFAGAMINTMRQSLDFEFLLRNPDYRQLICSIDADEKFNWLDFGMSQEKKEALFSLGCVKAIEFLENWHAEQRWEKYKKFRLNLHQNKS